MLLLCYSVIPDSILQYNTNSHYVKYEYGKSFAQQSQSVTTLEGQSEEASGALWDM